MVDCKVFSQQSVASDSTFFVSVGTIPSFVDSSISSLIFLVDAHIISTA
jgi:hypothetical protein